MMKYMIYCSADNSRKRGDLNFERIIINLDVQVLV